MRDFVGLLYRCCQAGSTDNCQQGHQCKLSSAFLFLGANIDAVETAARFGIGPDRAVNFHSDSRGQALNYKVVCGAVCQVRSNAPLGADWKDEIEADFRSR